MHGRSRPPSRTRPFPVITAFPTGSKVSAVPLPWREFPSMLPGFRFLLAAIVCSISLTIFGMGAAALLRASHEQFVSNSSWHSTQASGFTTFLPPAEPAPMLAVLRIEPILVAPAAPPVLVDAPLAVSEQPSTPAATAPVMERVDVTVAADVPAVPTPSLPAETVDTASVSVVLKTTSATDQIESIKPQRTLPDRTVSIIASIDKASDKPRMDSTPERATPAAPPAASEAAIVAV